MKTEIERLRRQVEELQAENLILRQGRRDSQRICDMVDMEDTHLDSATTLHESEERLRIAIEAARIGTYMTNLEADKVYWSPELCDILGVPQGMARSNEDAYKVVHEGDIERVLAVGRRGLDPDGDGSFCSEHRIVRPDGQVRWILWRGRTLFRETESGRIPSKRIGACVDITDRVQAEELLAESERRLSTLMANLPGMAYRCLNDNLWTMKFVSSGCLELMGFPPDHLLENRRTSYAELIHPDDRQMVWGQVESSLDRRSPFNLTYRIRTAGGDEKWVLEKGQGVFSSSGELLAIEGFITDITDRRRAEEALLRSEQLYRGIFESASIGMTRVSLDGIYREVNPAMTRILGYRAAELIGMPVEAFTYPEDLERRAQFLRDLIEGHIAFGEQERRFVHKNGSLVCTLISASVQRDPDGRPLSFISLVQDISERKAAVDALRESEERHRQIVESSTDAIVMRSGDAVIYANPAAVKLFRAGCAEDLVGKRYLDLVYPDDRAESIERIRRGSHEQWIAPLREHRILTLDGQPVHVESTGVPVQYRGETQLFGVFRDITGRKKAEEALRKSEEIFNSFMTHCPVYVFFKDETTRPIRLSRNYEQLLGRPIKELLGRTMDELFPSEMAKKMIEDDLSVIRGGRPIRVVEELNGRTFETMKFPILQPGKPNLLAGFTIDITERKQAEAAVRESEARYRSLIENIPQAVVLKDRESNYLSINTAYAHTFGLRQDQVIGKSDYDFHPKHLADKFRQEDRLVLETGENIEFEEEGVVDGEKRFYHKVKVPVRDSVGKIIGVLTTLSDVTDRFRMEEHLRHSQKTEAIGALAGGIAHDFNNILSAIIGYTELAMLNEGAERCAAELNEALTAANRAKDLVKQILAFSRQTDEDRMPVKVGLVAREAVKFLRATLPATIEIKMHIDDRSGTVLANSVELHQIIMNLCTNAQHAIGEQPGLLEIEVQDAEIELAQKNDLIDLEVGSYVRVSVKDTGDGMPSDVVKRIFDPYFTTKETGVGTGLGLAVVHGIVKKYGGTIKVESVPGRGSAFHIYLPKAERTAQIMAEQPKPIKGGSERILFIDDERMIVDVGQKALQKLGYHVVSRTSPIEALELFRAKPDHFDLVITDQTMPGMTGDALTRELMSIRPNVPVIICTGYSQRLNPERAKQIGIKAFVMKPILINEIAAAIRKVLDET